MRKPVFCICENKDAYQLRGDREADQRLCFRYTDSTIPLLPKSEISILYLSSVAVQPGLCWTWSETPKTNFLTGRLICNDKNKSAFFSAFDGFNMVPSLKPLETLHNNLTLKEMDAFLSRATTTKFFTPVSSPMYGATPLMSPRLPEAKRDKSKQL